MDLAFVLVDRPTSPAPAAIIAAGDALGIPMTLTSALPDDGPMSFALASGATVLYALMPAPHPGARETRGPLSPSPDELSRSGAHFIVTALGLQGDVDDKDLQMAALTAVLVQAHGGAVGAMLAHHATFLKAGLFRDFAALAVEDGQLPVELAVSITAAGEPSNRMSFLTHGLARYGREELYVTCPVTGRGALDFVLSMARWLYTDRSKRLPTGDTVGRTATEKIVVQRVPSPMGSGPDVIRLDLAS